MTRQIAFIFFSLWALFLTSCSDDSTSKGASRLPSLYLHGDEESLNLGDYSKAVIDWNDVDGNNTYKQRGKWRFRGNRSFEYPKKNFALKLKKPESFLGLPASKRWKVNADYIDKTLMRNKVSYDLFREFSKGNISPRIAYFNLFVNDEYRGVYALTQSMDENSLQLDKSDPKAVLFKEPPLRHNPAEHQERFRKFQNYSRTSERYDDFSEKARQKLVDQSYFNQRFPDIDQSDFSKEITAMTEFIFNASDAEFSNPFRFGHYFDLDNIIDWHLLILVTNNGDGFQKNYYLSRKKMGAPFLFTPWDYDHSFGREGDGEPAHEEIVNLTSMPLLNRLLESNAFGYRQKLYEKFMDLKARGVLTVEHIHTMMDANKTIIAPEMAKNNAKWPLKEIAYFKNASFYSELKLMKGWVEEHLPRLELYLSDLNNLIEPTQESVANPNIVPIDNLPATSSVKIDPYFHNPNTSLVRPVEPEIEKK